MTHTALENVSWLDRLFARAYRRIRRNYVEIWLAVSGLGIVLVAWPAQYATLLPLWGPAEPGSGEFWRAMSPCLVGTAFLMPWTALHPFRPIALFLRGKPVDPAAVWYACVRRITWTSAACTATYSIPCNIALLLVVGPPRGWDLGDYLSHWFVASMITVSAGFFFVLIWEVAFRPVLREIEPLLPAEFDPGSTWLTLSRRSALASSSAMIYTGAAVASLAAGTDDTDVVLATAVVATVGSAATFGGAITGLVAHSIFRRVHELRVALVRIGLREPGVRVAVRAGDELDAAALSLNRMAERLEHDDATLRASRTRLASVADAERRRMERDLRRRVLVRLEQVGDRLREVEDDLAERPDLADLHRLCDRVRSSVADAETEINRLARGVYPAELTEAGLGAALTAAAERSALPAVVDADGVGRLDSAREAAVYFACNEALQNAAKHAGEQARVTVTLARVGDRLTFAVADDGQGFTQAPVGRGLENMRDRVRAAGGDLTVKSEPGVATTVTGWVPA
ncbi:ATP-binding protein [Nocardioides stalactiti]|uniref:ATP-binding protein n=1 Tax=Nocardioides stalactiti TaxID=2755356 RepID=UPI00160429A6|nr:ATP-binding protein [Nocardioides stalactiti]